jgi:hypothetical protein
VAQRVVFVSAPASILSGWEEYRAWHAMLAYGSVWEAMIMGRHVRLFGRLTFAMALAFAFRALMYVGQARLRD